MKEYLETAFAPFYEDWHKRKLEEEEIECIVEYLGYNMKLLDKILYSNASAVGKPLTVSPGLYLTSDWVLHVFKRAETIMNAIESVAEEQRNLEIKKNEIGFLDKIITGALENQQGSSQPINKWVKYDSIKHMWGKLPDQIISFFIDRSVLTVKHNNVQFRNKLQFMAALYNSG